MVLTQIELKLALISQIMESGLPAKRFRSSSDRKAEALYSLCVDAAPSDGTCQPTPIILIILMPALLGLIMGESIYCRVHL